MGDRYQVQGLEGCHEDGDQYQGIDDQADQTGQPSFSQYPGKAHLLAQPLRADCQQQAGEDLLHDAGEKPADEEDSCCCQQIGEEAKHLGHHHLQGLEKPAQRECIEDHGQEEEEHKVEYDLGNSLAQWHLLSLQTGLAAYVLIDVCRSKNCQYHPLENHRQDDSDDRYQ